MRTETELILKSWRVIPGRLLGEGVSFAYSCWPDAARELCQTLESATGECSALRRVSSCAAREGPRERAIRSNR
jgi:hypothetical protein